MNPKTEHASSHFSLTSQASSAEAWEVPPIFRPFFGAKRKHWKRNLVSRGYPFALFLFDLCLISGLYLGSVWFNYGGNVFQQKSDQVWAAIVLCNVVGVYLIGGYNYRVDKRSFRFASEHLIVSGGVFLTALAMIYVFLFYGKSFNTARSTVFFPLLAFPLASALYRYCLAHAKAKFEVGNVFCIVGAGDEAVDLYRRLKDKGVNNHFVVVDPDESLVGRPLVVGDPQSPLVQSLEGLKFDASMGGKFVDGYVITLPLAELPESVASGLAVSKFNGNKVYTYDSYFMEELRMVPHSRLSLNWPLSEGFRLNRSIVYDRIKRLADIAASLLGIILLMPVLAMTAIAVRLTSEGPIIFRQIRVGHREQPFTIYKFRTMKVGSEKGPKYTQKSDSRITPIGNFLRKTRLDELPQLFNVLKGDLALIGPRAEWIDLVQGYEKRFPFYHFRHAVKPGITGWAQVNYPYGENDKDTLEKLDYDLYYVRKYSFVLDVSICVKTFYTMIFGMGR